MGVDVEDGHPLQIAIKNKLPPPSLSLSFTQSRCVNMVWLLVFSGATISKDCWQLCDDERVHKVLCRSWSTEDFKWFPTELKTCILR
jgi:hypothetical protein